MGQEIVVYPSASPDTPAPVASGLLGFVGAVASLGAIGASSCCVLPLMLAAVGASSGVFSFLEWLIPYRTPLLVIGGLAVAGGWFAWWRNKTVCEPDSACAEPRRSRSTMITLTVLSLLMLLALGWNFLEPTLIQYVRPLFA
jgi:mercuric ion transport protein